MTLITLTCPCCNFSREMDASRLPRVGTRVTCPRCQTVFPLGGTPDAPAEPGVAGAASPDAVAAEPGVAGGAPEAPQLRDPGEASSPAPEQPEFPLPDRVARDASAPGKPTGTRRTLSFTFTGNAREYFGIWIVNTLLRIVTLGLYSPWAKVRKRRYFYGNTLLDGAPFDYLADPWAILKGWLVAGLFFGLYSFASRTSPLVASGIGLLFLGVFPWVVVRSRIFNLRNSTHRNIRFGFNPDYREAYRVFLWWQILVPFTLGVLAPYVMYRQRRFLVENSRYGSTAFGFHAKAGDFYRVFLLPVLVLVPVALALFFGLAKLKPQVSSVALMAPGLVFALVYLVVALYIPTALTNLTWSSTTLAGHRFSCTLRLRDMLWIYLSNLVAIVCTLGMLAPWAAVRLVRYRLDRLTATGAGGLDAVRAAADQPVGAGAEELGDMLGFDLGL